MKKLVLFAVVAFSISFVSCSGKGSTETPSVTDSVPTTIIEEVEAIIPDSTNEDTTIVDEIAVETAEH